MYTNAFTGNELMSKHTSFTL